MVKKSESCVFLFSVPNAFSSTSGHKSGAADLIEWGAAERAHPIAQMGLKFFEIAFEFRFFQKLSVKVCASLKR